ncbi:YcjF family protein [Polycladidibacter stylochi]|uniref:YcjF family protein n=1 Tax=Polycladidibacter stylochi TaxID=1807766 RepID=UPI00082ABA89|nr:TIGR01620 family protein [Pseudovibrio stylochi]
MIKPPSKNPNNNASTPAASRQQRRAPKSFIIDDTTAKQQQSQQPQPQQPIQNAPLVVAIEAHEETAQQEPVSTAETRHTNHKNPSARSFKNRAMKLLVLGFGGLLSLSIGLAIDQLIRDLFTRYEWLGWVGVAFLCLGALALAFICVNELRSLSRLKQIDNLRNKFNALKQNSDEHKTDAALKQLIALYQDRPHTAKGRAILNAHMQEVIDPKDLLILAERDLLVPIDQQARQLVIHSAKRVSIVTALSPRALVDIGIVFYECLKLIKNIAQLYGGRPGTLGYWRLASHVATHLALTGGLAAGDGLLEQFIGQGLAAKVSARMGEGVVNGFLTSRVGIAAIDCCRPAPFIEAKGPQISEVLSEIMRKEKAEKTERANKYKGY